MVDSQHPVLIAIESEPASDEMNCTQSIPQFHFISTQPSPICSKDSTFMQSNCCNASPVPCGTAAFLSPLVELYNHCSQSTDIWPLQYSPPSAKCIQMDNVNQELWNTNGTTSPCPDDQQFGISLDQGLGISTDGSNYAAAEMPTYDECGSLMIDQKPLYPAQQPNEQPPSSPVYQYSVPAADWDGAYLCGTPNAADPAIQLSSLQHNTPLQLHEHFLQQPFSTPAEFSEFVPESITGDEGMFKHPMHPPYSMTSGTPQTTVYPWVTPIVQASPTAWSAPSAKRDYSDTPYSRSSLPLPKYVLDYSTDYSIQESMRMMHQQPQAAMMTPPPRRMPRIRSSLSDSSVPRISSTARMRAASMNHHLHPPQYDYSPNHASVPQLPLPPLLPSMLINASPTLIPPPSLPATPSPQCRVIECYSDTPQRQSQPSSPPDSDFNQSTPFSMKPVRQQPAFDGDTYTPEWRRRTPNGRWEGWCGYCQPGRWLDLKNSRYWEDKLRNHGICAKTKRRFVDPIQIRWVSADGLVIPASRVDFEHRYLDGRKREGLCGTCNDWISMDGPRCKALDRPVNWYMHAYKCHNHTGTDTEVSPQSK